MEWEEDAWSGLSWDNGFLEILEFDNKSHESCNVFCARNYCYEGISQLTFTCSVSTIGLGLKCQQ